MAVTPGKHLFDDDSAGTSSLMAISWPLTLLGESRLSPRRVSGQSKGQVSLNFGYVLWSRGRFTVLGKVDSAKGMNFDVNLL